MRGSVQLTGLTRDDIDSLAGIDHPLAVWLARIADGVPAPEGNHGQLAFSITVEWDHVKPLGTGPG